MSHLHAFFFRGHKTISKYKGINVKINIFETNPIRNLFLCSCNAS